MPDEKLLVKYEVDNIIGRVMQYFNLHLVLGVPAVAEVVPVIPSNEDILHNQGNANLLEKRQLLLKEREALELAVSSNLRAQLDHIPAEDSERIQKIVDELSESNSRLKEIEESVEKCQAEWDNLIPLNDEDDES